MVWLALVGGVLAGVGVTLWLVRPRPVRLPFARSEPDPAGVTGYYRVTREMDGRVEVLHQGGGALAGQLYAYHNPTRPGERIVFYRGDAECSAKGGV